MLAAVDIETLDPHLKEWGPGAIRKDGHIIGVGIYSPELQIDGFYHPDDPIIRKVLEDENVTKICHNGVYDLDWLIHGYGFTVNGRVEDTMTRETLLDSYAYSYSLDASCIRRGVEGKNKTDTIDAWYADNISKRGKAIEHLDQIPFNIVGKYCRQDCKATYELFLKQQPLLEAQDLLRANEVEVQLYPWLMKTRGNGMIIDWKAWQILSDSLNDELSALRKDFCSKYGDVNINSANDLAAIWKKEHLPIEYTASGRPSFTADILDDCMAPVAHQIKRMRALEKLLGTFIDGQFVDLAYNGRLYPILYPAKRDEGGTVTGRFSSSNPNGQNIPAREDKHGKEVRSLFIPEDGCLLGAFDFKQIEYRIFTHFASGPGALEAQQKFRDDPDTDYHQMTIDLMGWGGLGKEGRHLAKNFNFGTIYGLGPRSFAQRFKQNLLYAHPDADPDNLVPLATSLMQEYNSKVTFAKPTCQDIQRAAMKRGYVRTLSGRRQRMPDDGKVYKLVNYLIQGSAADVFKKGVCVDAWKAGVWDVLIPHVMVHDEVVFSIPQTKEGYEACEELYNCMVHGYELNIPLGVDTEIGPNWGHCTIDNWKEFKGRFA